MDPVSSERSLRISRIFLLPALLLALGLSGCTEGADDGPWVIGPSPEPEIVEPVYQTLDGNCAIDTEALAYCWGSWGSAPVRVAGDYRWSAVSGTWNFACGITGERDLYCWEGMPDIPTPMSPAREWASLSVMNKSICAVDVNGTGFCRMWRDGELRADLTEAPGDRSWASLTVSEDHACGVTVEGEGFCWGRDNFSELGYEGSEFVDTLMAAPGAPSWKAIDTSTGRTCGVTTSSVLLCWGYNEFEELGAPPMDEGYYFDPVAVRGGAPIFEAVFLGPGDWWDAADFSCARSAADGMLCWGDSRGATAVSFRPNDWVRIEKTANGLCGLTSDGEIFCWEWDASVLDEEPAPLPPAEVWPGSDMSDDPAPEAP